MIQPELKAYRRCSDRHVLVLETNLTYVEKCQIFHYADLIRKAGNELTGIMKKRYDQLVRTKRYRKLKSLYKKYKDADNKKALKDVCDQMKEMQKQYDVTWDYCRTSMIPIGKKYGIDAVFALTKAEDVFHGIEKCLYSDGETIHFKKRGDLPCIRAKQINRGIIMKQMNFKFKNMEFGVNIKDRYEQEEVDAILYYLKNAELMDSIAANTYKETDICVSTYRPCYVSLVCKKIRGKLRVYVHITIEGLSKPKQDRFGNFKHSRGSGIVGCDVGTQTIAYTTETKAGLKNLAERGSCIEVNERKERRIYRAMDRSRRAMNPDNYNEDGTIKKGKKKWTYSNRYKKLRTKHTELCRINATNRHLAINEDVNELRSLGDVFVTEPKNAKKLQKRAKTGKRKKRFGRSIKNRCPGYFQSQAKRKFRIYVEVPNDYKASQYDHTSDEYIKKSLSQRMYRLSDGTMVQRDLYSSFLLYCIDLNTNKIDKNKCIHEFENQYKNQNETIEYIQMNQIKVMNSGIRVN